MRMNTNKKTILLSSVTVTTLALGATAIALSNSSSNNQLNKDLLLTQKQSISVREVSPNGDRKGNLVNPDELFYMSPVLTPESHPIIEGDVINQTNVELWKKFSQNIKAIPIPSSLPSSIQLLVQKLQDISTQIEGTIKLRSALEASKKDFITNMTGILPDPAQFWEDTIKEQIVQQSGFKENIAEIDGINEIQQNLLILSGIVDGTKISSIASANLKERNLSGDNGSTSSPISIGDVAGQWYTQLVKIAEIDPSKTGNYVLKFQFKKNNNAFPLDGTLIIKNDKNQLSSVTNVSDLVKNFDIFGRWNSNAELDQGNAVSFENFVVQKSTSGKVELLVRVKDQEMVQNLEFLSELEGSESIVTPDQFGILDVQATNSSTFKGKILADGTTTLVDNISDTSKVISSIEFFGKTLTAKYNSNRELTNFEDHTLEFYQGKDSEVKLGLNHAYKEGAEAQNQLSYKPINIYENGIDTKKQQELTLSANGTEPSSFDPATYDLYSTIREQLPQEITEDNFEQASTIKLTSGLDSTNAITRQTLKFTAYFYSIGNRDNYENINVNGDIQFIEISDITQKIFFEKPKSFSDQSLTNKESTFKAKESVNERAQVLSILGSVYNEFSKSSSGIFNGETYDLGSQTLWIGSKNDSKFTNIRTQTEKISGSANTIYNKLNSNWNDVSSFMNQLFSIEKSNRYDGSSIDSAKSVINNFLARITEYTSNSADVESIINNSIQIVKSQYDTIDQNTTFDSLSIENKKALAKQVAQLIKYQFGTINNEFIAQQYGLVYDSIKNALESTETKTYSVIKAPEEILEIYNSTSQDASNIKVFKYKDNIWNSGVATSSNVTLKDSALSLFKLLYFNNGDTNLTRLGDSIFNSSENDNVFSSLDATSLVTFTSDTVAAKQDKVLVYSQILSTLGHKEFDLQGVINKMLSSGTRADLNEATISNWFNQTIHNITSPNFDRKTESTDSTKVSSSYLDDLISGSNIIICMKWKLSSLGGSSFFAHQDGKATTSELYEKINTILNTNSQYSPSELGIWSNIINGKYDFAKFT
ncbi:hypothetical protein ACJA28_03405 [Mesomycoplasma moatsii]|uniref:hypothetical protein n=1 Tax=Mesomycoplasma moatsii TaxID=171287 RepID=UPI003872B5B7